MNVMKCEPDPDGESFVTSCDSESQLNDKDRVVMELPVTDSENECLQLNVDTIKVEHETHLLQHAVETVETLNEGDVTDNSSHLSLSPVCPLIKCETEVITDLIKSEPDSYCETCASPSHIENEMTGAKEEEDPLLLRFPLMQNENEVVMDPGDGGGKPSRIQRNSRSEDQLRCAYISAPQLSASPNQDILRRARNAERKRRSRQSQQANETLQEAVLRRAQHAEEVRKWYQLRQASETPQEAASRRARHAEIMRQRRQSQRESETPEEAALRRAQHAAEVRRWRHSRQDSETSEVAASRRFRNAEGVRRWRESQQANETPQVAASRRAQHAAVMRQWRQFQRVHEIPEDPALLRAQQTDQVRRLRATRRPRISKYDSFVVNEETPDERRGGLAR